MKLGLCLLSVLFYIGLVSASYSQLPPNPFSSNFNNPYNANDTDFSTYSYTIIGQSYITSNFTLINNFATVNYTFKIEALASCDRNYTVNCFYNNMGGIWDPILTNKFNTSQTGYHSIQLPEGCVNWPSKNISINFTVDNCAVGGEEWKFYEGELNYTGYFIENSQTYSNLAYENSIQNLSINITYDFAEYTSLTAYLNYNGTIYPGDVSNLDGNTIISRSIITPSSNSSLAYPFYWILNLTNSSGVNTFNSSNYTQTVSPITLSICNPTYNISFINFTLYNSESPYNLLNGTFKAKFSYGVNSTSAKNYTYQDINNNLSTFSFCLFPTSINYTISSSIEYSSPNYSLNHYYINDMLVTNQSQVIPLYLLNESKATLTEFQVTTSTKLPLENVYITVQKYDQGTDTYYSVAMLKTSYSGSDIAYLNWYDTFYKFILVENGEVIKSTNITKIYSTPQRFTKEDIFTFNYDKFENVQYTLNYNNGTKNFILTYVSPDSSIKRYCLKVFKRTSYNDSIVCNTCETSSSATLYCNINSYGNGTFIGVFNAYGSLKSIDFLTIQEGINEIYTKIGVEDGSIYALFLAGIVLVMFMITPALGVIGALLGILLGMLFGFLPINYTEYIGLVLVGGTIIWLAKR